MFPSSRDSQTIDVRMRIGLLAFMFAAASSCSEQFSQPNRMANPKIEARIELPRDLIQFFGAVNSMIVAEEEATLVESDDLIQPEPQVAYGGLTDKASGLYFFTYFPVRGSVEVKWQLNLLAPEIASIAEGLLDSVPGWRCRDEDCGNRFSNKDEYCHICDHPLGREGVLKLQKEQDDQVKAMIQELGEEGIEAMRAQEAAEIEKLLEDS